MSSRHFTYKNIPCIFSRKTISKYKTKRSILLFLFAFLTVVLLQSYYLINFKIERTGVINFSPLTTRSECQNVFLSNFTTVYKLLYGRVIAQYSDLSESFDCKNYLKFNGISLIPTEEEVEFPLAFALTVYENIEQFARLLRLIYRPHNLYCVHVDQKASPHLLEDVRILASCLGNNIVILQRMKRVDVHWGYFTVLKAVTNCAETLVNTSEIVWKYMINVNEKEFPLRTNWELVVALKSLNGSNVVECFSVVQSGQRLPKDEVDFKMRWMKGSLLCALRRDFVNFSIQDPRAQKIFAILEAEQHLQKIPDEIFYPTLAHNPQLGAPGACLSCIRPNKTDSRSLLISRYISWGEYTCESEYIIRGVCIWGIKDVPILIKRPEFFTNKFMLSFQPAAYDCMQHWMEEKMVKEFQTKKLSTDFDEHFYRNLYCSTNHI